MEASIIPAYPNPPIRTAQQAFALTLAAEVLRLVTLSRGMATAGRQVSLVGLENAVGLLCAKALDLEPQEVAPVRAQLVLLGLELDRLAATIWPNRASVGGVAAH